MNEIKFDINNILLGVIGLVVGFYVWVIKAWVQFPDDPLFLFLDLYKIYKLSNHSFDLISVLILISLS